MGGVVLWLVVGAAACSPAPPAPASPPSTATTVATIELPVSKSPSAAPVDAVVPPGSAQVLFRLHGLDQPADELTAELESVATGEVRRWPVDNVTNGTTAGVRAVTVPVYAVPAGEHVLTIWQGDADAVQRYTIRIVAP